MKKEEDARLPLEEAKTQAQLLIRYVAINQRAKLIFSSVITTHLYTQCQPVQKYVCSRSSISVEHHWYPQFNCIKLPSIPAPRHNILLLLCNQLIDISPNCTSNWHAPVFSNYFSVYNILQKETQLDFLEHLKLWLPLHNPWEQSPEHASTISCSTSEHRNWEAA